MTSIAPTSGTTPSTPETVAPSSGKALMSSDFDTFLKLFTAQLKNQDPLNPLDSADYAVQLATFSGVEQQAKTNELLNTLLAQTGASSMAQMAEWVGKEVRVEAPVNFRGDPITLSPSPPAHASRSELVAIDSAGAERARTQIPVSDAPVEWAGTGADGAPVARGDYTFVVESFDLRGTQIDSHAPQVYARVTEARSSNGEITLVLPGGIVVDTTKVTAVRNPDPGAP